MTRDLPPDELRRLVRRAAEWSADYLQGVEQRSVLPKAEPGSVRRMIPRNPPDVGESLDTALADFEEWIVPGITHWAHPGFFGYFPSGGSGAGVIGEILASALNANAMVWRSSPAGTELELAVTDWLRQLLGLSAGIGIINDTASSSTMYALTAARDRAYPDVSALGLFGECRGRVYTSVEAHSSVDKAARTVGLGAAEKIAVDGDLRMRVDLLREAIARDVSRGVRPVAVVVTLGTTSTASLDPVREAAAVAAEAGAWLHVDAAYGGVAAIVPELRPLFRGWELADSVVVNPHKWLFTPLDCSVLFCRRPADLRRAFSIRPEVLTAPRGKRRVGGIAGAGPQVRENNAVDGPGGADRSLAQDTGSVPDVGEGPPTDLMDYGISLGRRFRSLKLWLVLRYFGREGLVEVLRSHVAMCRDLEAWIDAEPGWERFSRSPLATTVFRWVGDGTHGGEAVNEANFHVLEYVNDSGRAFITHTVIDGRVALRVAVGNVRTTKAHVEDLWRLLREGADSLGTA